MFLETGEITQPKGFVNSNIYGYWKKSYNSKLEAYTNIIDAFFSKGAVYKGDIILGNTMANTTEIKDQIIGKRFNYDMERAFKLEFFIPSGTQDSGTIEVISGEDTVISIEFDLDEETLVYEEIAELIYVYDDNLDVTNRKFSLTIQPVAIYDEALWFNFSDLSSGYWGVKQYQISFQNFSALDTEEIDEEIVNNLYVSDIIDYQSTSWGKLVSVDCTDYASFLWAAKKGTILKEKAFSCEKLIDKTFEQLEFCNKVLDFDIDKLISVSETGDLLIFENKNIYHVITILDTAKKTFTECSGRIEYLLGYQWNCKVSEFVTFTDRFMELSENSNIYHARLI